MIKIEVDPQVFEFLQKNAKPLVDTPNTVLRRLLQLDKAPAVQKDEVISTMTQREGRVFEVDTNEFVRIVLKTEFEEELQKKSPFRYMFESVKSLVYFQNFNKESPTLWYRVTGKPFKVLKASSKKCYLCLTNPAERVAYLLPFKEVEKRILSSNWERDYLEINIDHTSSKWKELDWNIKQFLKTY